jgi:hypothetical protein
MSSGRMSGLANMANTLNAANSVRAVPEIEKNWLTAVMAIY